MAGSHFGRMGGFCAKISDDACSITQEVAQIMRLIPQYKGSLRVSNHITKRSLRDLVSGPLPKVGLGLRLRLSRTKVIMMVRHL